MSELKQRTDILRVAVPLVFGAIVGFVLWSASQSITGHKEPWDGDFGFYLACMLGIGFAAGIAVPRLGYFWACPLGVYIGQATAMLLLLKPGPLAPLGLFLALPFASAVVLVGWMVGAGIHHAAALAIAGLSSNRPRK